MNRLYSVTKLHGGYTTSTAGFVMCFLPTLAAARVVYHVADALGFACIKIGTQVTIGVRG